MKVLFLGGPGNISESAIRYLLQKGNEIAAVKRRNKDLFGLENDIRIYYGNRDDAGFLGEVLNEYGPEIVVDCTCFELSQAEAVISAIREHPVRRLVFVSTADVYGYPLSRLPMHEDDPWRETNCEYAENKKQIEALYGNAFEGSAVSLTVVRPSYSLGKTFALSSFERDRGKYLVARLREGAPIYSPGDGTTLIDVTAAHNTGIMLAMICETDATCGEDYNLTYHGAVTYDEYIGIFADVLGVKADIVHIPTDFMFSLGRKEVSDSILGDLAKYHLYFSADKFKKTFPDFKWEFTLEDAVRDYIRYQEETGGFEGTEQMTFEDKVVSCWLDCMGQVKDYVNERV